MSENPGLVVETEAEIWPLLRPAGLSIGAANSCSWLLGLSAKPRRLFAASSRLEGILQSDGFAFCFSGSETLFAWGLRPCHGST